MDTDIFDERILLTRPLVERVIQKWVAQLPAPCHTGERQSSILHGPVPLASRRRGEPQRYVAVWALYEGPGREVKWWAAVHVWRWRWRALRYARRQARRLLVIRHAVHAAQERGS